jgi:uncharacterized lipoprotein YmbA
MAHSQPTSMNARPHRGGSPKIAAGHLPAVGGRMTRRCFAKAVRKARRLSSVSRLVSTVSCLLSRVSSPLSPVTCLLICLALTSCSLLPEPQTDPTRFYVLATDAARTSPPANGPVVHLREVELASYLRTRPIIVRRGENEIEFREFAVWGEPLELGVARVLREELLARGAASAVVSSSVRRTAGGADLDLSVRVLACEGGPGGTVAFRAVWELAKTESKTTALARGDFRAADLRWDGKNEASLVAQLSQAIAGLAAEISAALAAK